MNTYSQKYPMHTKYPPRSPIFPLFALWPPFLRQEVFENRKNQKCTEVGIPEPEFDSVLLYGQPFLRYMVPETRKNRKCTEWPQYDLEHLTFKSTLHTLITLEAQRFVSFALRRAIFKIQGCVNKKNRKCTEWLQNDLEDLTVKNTMYTVTTYPRGPNFAPLRSTTSLFPDMAIL